MQTAYKLLHKDHLSEKIANSANKQIVGLIKTQKENLTKEKEALETAKERANKAAEAAQKYSDTAAQLAEKFMDKLTKEWQMRLKG